MKGIRGRYGQHRILETDSSLSMYLLETKLLSEATFYDLSEKYNFLMIKPLVGPQQVHITVNDNEIELKTGIEVLRFSSIEEAYDYLTTHICTRKYYVIQALPTNPSKLSHCRFTLHRKSPKVKWKIVHSTTVDENRFSDAHLFHIWKLNSSVTFVAKKLGAAFPGCHTIVVEVAIERAGKFWIADTILHERNSKWSQYHSLHLKRSLRAFLPATDLCTKQTLLAFLNTYPEVIIKPCVGQQGRGIVKIATTGEMNFEVHERRNRKCIEDFDQLFRYLLEEYLLQKDYIVQQRISLAELDGNPFDVRVITQIDEGSWIMTGQVVKVAAKDYFVSNRASKLLTLENALSESGNETSLEHCAKRIEKVCKKASKRLWRNIGKISIIGFDIGIDGKGEVWVIEGNYAPSLSMFYMFGNNEIHERISYYIRKHKKSG
ncbi:YheC/YheD family protein [Sporosarcina sp. Marseille-Q4943]|uniref:YheC/YheD family protein n=1 Tax=Sporosarcina sp. Marseille-Q4943 TaxID=2942204 RepID=UPI00208DCFE6|nr:YheC/YheD family protein [Sporosarcina sp. Marseille-Q4943]